MRRISETPPFRWNISSSRSLRSPCCFHLVTLFPPGTQHLSESPRTLRSPRDVLRPLLVTPHLLVTVDLQDMLASLKETGLVKDSTFLVLAVPIIYLGLLTSPPPLALLILVDSHALFAPLEFLILCLCLDTFVVIIVLTIGDSSLTLNELLPVIVPLSSDTPSLCGWLPKIW